MKVTFAITGMQGLARAMTVQTERYHRAYLRGLYKAGTLVEAEAKRRCPVDTGRLRATGYTAVEGVNVYVGFGTNYALYVHEIPDGAPVPAIISGARQRDEKGRFIKKKGNKKTVVRRGSMRRGRRSKVLRVYHRVGESFYLRRALEHMQGDIPKIVADYMGKHT